MTGGKIALLITGVVLALLGFGAAVTGGGMLWAHSTQRAADGYLTSPTYTLHSDGSCAHRRGDPPRRAVPGRLVRLVQPVRGPLRRRAVGLRAPVFVGVGPAPRSTTTSPACGTTP
jgi:hypothetical protein